MAAFSDRTFSALLSKTRLIFEKLSALNTIELSHADVINTLAPPESRRILLEAWKHTSDRLGNQAFSVSWHNVYKDDVLSADEHVPLHFFMVSAGRQAALAPLAPVVQPDADPAIVDKITSWVTYEVRAMFDATVVNEMICLLNRKCSSPQQVRFFFPSVLTLLRMADETKLVEKLTKVRAPKELPSFLPSERDMMRYASGVMASYELLDKPKASASQTVSLGLPNGSVSVTAFGRTLTLRTT